MKRTMILLLSGIVLVVSIFLISFYSWEYFNKRKPNLSGSKLEIVLSDDQELDLADQAPVDNNSASTVTPYVFSVKNSGKSTGKYEILLEDFISDGGDQLLSRSVLDYQLKSGGVIVSSGKLGDIKNNILITGEINPETSRKYELRIWVRDNTPTDDWVGRTYNYNVKVNQISD